MTQTHDPALETAQVAVGYRDHPVLRDVTVGVPRGGFTAIVGPNGCGKSTLLKTVARLLRPSDGSVSLDGEALAGMRGRVLARRLSLLPQDSPVPDGIRVRELVARGRYPHQSLFSQWSSEDEQAVERALALTRIDDLADRLVDTLSGGQRQRAWIALALAQDTDVLLLDEPTTFLDIAHQMEVMRLLESLRSQGTTIVAVLHDLNHAARFATQIIAMRDGRVHGSGAPSALLTPETIEKVFGLRCRVIADPDTGDPVILPR